MIGLACTQRAAWSTFSPTAPAPTTSTLAPGRTRASRITAPTPDMTPQAMRQARSSGMFFETGTASDSGTTLYSAWEEAMVE